VGGSPQLPEPLAQWVPQRVKVENFFYILNSSGPRPVQRHQCYTTCWGRSCCKRATVPYLPIRPYSLQGVTQKWKISYIFSIPAAHAEYTTTNVIPPIGALAGVNRLPCHISQFTPAFHTGGKNQQPPLR